MIQAVLLIAGLMTAQTHADQGFRAYAAGDYAAAVAAFDQALALDPGLGAVVAQRAYALKALGRNADAAQGFRAAMALGLNGEDDAYAREIRTLENRFDFSFYSVYREAALGSDFLAVAGPSLTQSQSGVEAAWTPPGIGYRDGRIFQIFSRLLWGYEGNSLRLDDNSWQAGAGVRWKPLRATNLVFSGERLIAVADNARDDWMLRASYSWDRGFALDRRRSSWRYLTFYADIAVIDPADPDLFLASEARFGQTFRLGHRLTVTPHAMISGVVQKDSFHTTSIIEAGPGLSLKHHGQDVTLELLTQYRQKLAGDSLDASGFVMTLVLHY